MVDKIWKERALQYLNQQWMPSDVLVSHVAEALQETDRSAREEVQSHEHNQLTRIHQLVGGDTKFGDVVPYLDSQLQRAHEIEEALVALVSLKKYKDTYGKTEGYLHKRPLAWKKAREVLGLEEE